MLQEILRDRFYRFSSDDDILIINLAPYSSTVFYDIARGDKKI